MFTKTLTGARMLWIGCAPVGQRARLLRQSQQSRRLRADLGCLPDDLRERTRPVAGADYWLKGKLRTYVAERVIRAVLIDRNPETRTQDPIKQMADVIEHGDSLIVFPEGTRNTTDETLLPFKSGIFHLAAPVPTPSSCRCGSRTRAA